MGKVQEGPERGNLGPHGVRVPYPLGTWMRPPASQASFPKPVVEGSL